MLVRDKDITSEGNLGGLVVNMSLDEKGLSKIMGLLTNLYSDPLMATIRETCTNAIDSHIAAGQKKPIEISTPSRMYPYFIVQDFGLGMSTDDVVNVVSKYGASTKNKSDDFNGMMGIGLKSPLAYTDQFTITGIKDGKKSFILVSRTNDGASSMEIVDVSDTDEPNGVTIKVPVNKDFDLFAEKIKTFCTYADKDKFLLNGSVFENNFEHLKDNIYIYESSGWNSRPDKIVMGNVAYPIDAQRLMPNHGVVFYVPMGSVAFTPSREDLEYTKTTKQTIDDEREKFELAYSEWLSEITEKQSTYVEAVQKSFEIRQRHNVSKPLTWQGEELPLISPSYRDAYWGGDLTDSNDGWLSYYNRSWTKPYDKIIKNGDIAVVINFNNARFTRIQARKVVEFFGKKDLDIPSRVYLHSSSFDLRLIGDVEVYDWDDIKKVKLVAPNATSGKKTAATLEGIPAGQRGFQFYAPDKKKPLYYGTKTEMRNTSVYKDIASEGDNFVFVVKSKKEKFLKDYPKAIHYREWYKQVVQKYIDTLTPADYDYFEMDVHNFNLSFVDANAILDPELKMIAENNHASSPKTLERDKYERFLNYIPWKEKEKLKFPDNSRTAKGYAVLDRYPLLRTGHNGISRDSSLQQHLVWYVNEVYTQRNGKNATI